MMIAAPHLHILTLEGSCSAKEDGTSGRKNVLKYKEDHFDKDFISLQAIAPLLTNGLLHQNDPRQIIETEQEHDSQWPSCQSRPSKMP